MASPTLNAIKREDIANSAMKSSKQKGNIPGIFYYKGVPSVPIYVKDTSLNPFIYTSEVKVISLKIEGTEKAYDCILKDIQFDPVTDKPIHFDLLGVSGKEKIKVDVPIVLAGVPAGVKEGGIIQHAVHQVEVECFPKDIPSQIEINIEALNIGDSLNLSEIKQENFLILDNLNTTIVAVLPPTVEKVEEVPVEGEVPAEEAPAEPEVISKGKKEEEEEEEKEKEKGKEK